MINISLPDDVAQELSKLAETQHRPIADIVADMLNRYKSEEGEVEKEMTDSAFEAVIGIFDDDITDLSSTTRETLRKSVQDKYGRSD